MYTELDIKEFNDRFKRRRARIRNISKVMMAIALIVAAMLGAVTFVSLFHVSIVLMVVVFAAGVIVDLQINLEKLPKLMELVLIRHLFKDLEAEQVQKQLMQQAKDACSEAEQALAQAETEDEQAEAERALGEAKDAKRALKEDTKKYMDRWLVLRREYFRQHRDATSEAFIANLEASLGEDSDLSPNKQRFLKFAMCCEHQLVDNRAGSQSTLRFKKVMTIVGLPLSMTAGLGFGSIGYASFMMLLGLLGVSVATMPFLWVGLGVAVAVIAGTFWTATMYKTFYSAVKSNIFKTLYNKLRFDVEGFRNQTSLSGRLKMIMGAAAKYIAATGLSLLGVIAIVASCGAYGSAILDVCSFIPTVAVFIIGFAMLPVRMLFAMKHAVSAVCQMSKRAVKGYDWFAGKTAKQHFGALMKWYHDSFCKEPLKYVLIAVLGPIFFAATLLHVVAEAALDMGGNATNDFWQRIFDRFNWSYQLIDKFMHAIARLAHVTAQQLIVLVQSFIEFLEHMDFAFRQAPKMTEDMTNFFVGKPTEAPAAATKEYREPTTVADEVKDSSMDDTFVDETSPILGRS